ncbi:hypothetical protein EI94DRAFT_1818911 [Lactarius quietus]|nr:hypothetical protein EI94DRAFT_1818911 [Lactarius quietus]
MKKLNDKKIKLKYNRIDLWPLYADFPALSLPALSLPALSFSLTLSATLIGLFPMGEYQCANIEFMLEGRTRLAVPVVWVFNGGVLLANEWYEGYAFASLHLGFAFLDTWHGVYPRWHVSFNITMLRLMSFSVDYHWACSHISITDSNHSLGELIDKKRAAVFHPRAMYTFLNYLAYMLYTPLYIMGPIITFKDFMWHVRPTLSSMPWICYSHYDVALTHKDIILDVVLEFFRFVPKGTWEVGETLHIAGDALVKGGQTKLFTPMYHVLPMYLVVARQP